VTIERNEQAQTDQPEPEDVLDEPEATRNPDHEPSDSDDRIVELDDPARFEPPVDEDDLSLSGPDDHHRAGRVV
jgi:hypothetical protein